MTVKSVDLFTKEEHVIIAGWLGVEPKYEASNFPATWDALETLGYHGKASGYGEDDAAVADMVLERINDTLPHWASVKIRKNDDEKAVITLGREVRARLARRKIELVPQYLMTINWADSGPVFHGQSHITLHGFRCTTSTSSPNPLTAPTHLDTAISLSGTSPKRMTS